jgi:hypothetical protein
VCGFMAVVGDLHPERFYGTATSAYGTPPPRARMRQRNPFGIAPASALRVAAACELVAATETAALTATVLGHTTSELLELGLGSVRLTFAANGGVAARLASGVHVVGVQRCTGAAAGGWLPGLACVPPAARHAADAGAVAEVMLMAGHVQTLAGRVCVACLPDGGSDGGVGGGVNDCRRSDAAAVLSCRGAFGVGTRVRVLVLRPALGGFSAIATGPWLRDRIVHLLEAFEATASELVLPGDVLGAATGAVRAAAAAVAGDGTTAVEVVAASATAVASAAGTGSGGGLSVAVRLISVMRKRAGLERLEMPPGQQLSRTIMPRL